MFGLIAGEVFHVVTCLTIGFVAVVGWCVAWFAWQMVRYAVWEVKMMFKRK